MTPVAVRHGFVDGRFVENLVVSHAHGRITEIRPWTSADPAPLDGTLLPGLINAHLHLELSWTHGRVPGGDGFDGWIQRALSLPPDEPEPAMDAAVADLVSYGTAAVSDICNGPDTGARLAAAGIGGVVQRELFSMHAPRLPGLLERAQEPPVVHDSRVRVVSRASPHATYSTPGPLVRATVEAAGLGHPASIHVSEDPGEHAFLESGGGSWPARLDALGLDWAWWSPPGLTPTGWLDALGVLGPGLMLVHGVHLTPADRALAVRAGSPLCLCPRSNLHIGGVLPDLPALLESGLTLALGTDGLGSCPDLDVLSELPVLREAFPAVPVERLLEMATSGGADALNLDWAGRLDVGRAPGLLLVEGPPADLFDAPRRWLERPGVAA